MLRLPIHRALLCVYSRTHLPCACFRKARSETFYDILGVKRTATDKEIKEAYINLCKQFHPDSNSQDKKLHEKFIKINQAYAVLSKPSERRLYDAALNAGLNPEPGEKFTTEDWDPKKPMYYYHPRFYNDPKMREAAAKAWEQNTGYSFEAYTRDDYDPNRPVPKGLGLHFAILVLFIGAFIGVLTYMSGKDYVKDRRKESYLANRRFDEQAVSEVVRRAKPRSSRRDDSSERKTPASKDTAEEKDLSLDYMAQPEKPLGTA